MQYVTEQHSDAYRLAPLWVFSFQPNSQPLIHQYVGQAPLIIIFLPSIFLQAILSPFSELSDISHLTFRIVLFQIKTFLSPYDCSQTAAVTAGD